MVSLAVRTAKTLLCTFLLALALVPRAARADGGIRRLTSTFFCFLTGSIETAYYTVDIGLEMDFETDCSDDEITEIGRLLDHVIDKVNITRELGLLRIANDDVCLVDPDTTEPEDGGVRRQRRTELRLTAGHFFLFRAKGECWLCVPDNHDRKRRLGTNSKLTLTQQASQEHQETLGRHHDHLGSAVEGRRSLRSSRKLGSSDSSDSSDDQSEQREQREREGADDDDASPVIPIDPKVVNTFSNNVPDLEKELVRDIKRKLGNRYAEKPSFCLHGPTFNDETESGLTVTVDIMLLPVESDHEICSR